MRGQTAMIDGYWIFYGMNQDKTFDFFLPWIFSSWMGPLGFFVFSLLLLIFEEELEEYNFFFLVNNFFFTQEFNFLFLLRRL
jgi:hypothetical protein